MATKEDQAADAVVKSRKAASELAEKLMATPNGPTEAKQKKFGAQARKHSSSDVPSTHKPLQFVKSAQGKARVQQWADRQRVPPTKTDLYTRVLIITLTTLGFFLFGLRMWVKYSPMLSRHPDDKGQYILFSPEMLAQHVHEFGDKIYIAILGEVYDVSRSPKFYGVDGGYESFSGRDASRAFITGKFTEDLNDNISDFTDEQMKGLVDWKAFYLKEYTFVGRVVGAFFDSKGRMTPHLQEVMLASRRARDAQELRDKNKVQAPACNKRWSQAQGGEVWCDNEMYPRIVTERVGEKDEKRCACYQAMGWSNLRSVYPDCSPSAHRCQTSKPAASPDKPTILTPSGGRLVEETRSVDLNEL